MATGQLCDRVGRILPFPPIQDDWLPRMNASKDLFLTRLEDFTLAAVEDNPLRPMI
ncbi:hypothetical protein NW756_014521 [Fusarium oxysporum]|nr:hypothetical protein NW753_014573 [Fusarium oxysporum]KAJ4030598.1 hypothetical protein NW763_014838 [Fusarium oxysporum]KAJ4072696.1 hypothetical protein NW756_014521 [Fusarium oxysporum]